VEDLLRVICGDGDLKSMYNIVVLMTFASFDAIHEVLHPLKEDFLSLEDVF
jgi:hypothetical protein